MEKANTATKAGDPLSSKILRRGGCASIQLFPKLGRWRVTSYGSAERLRKRERLRGASTGWTSSDLDGANWITVPENLTTLTHRTVTTGPGSEVTARPQRAKEQKKRRRGLAWRPGGSGPSARENLVGVL